MPMLGTNGTDDGGGSGSSASVNKEPLGRTDRPEVRSASRNGRVLPSGSYASTLGSLMHQSATHIHIYGHTYVHYT